MCLVKNILKNEWEQDIKAQHNKLKSNCTSAG